MKHGHSGFVRSTLPALKMASAPSGRIEPPADDVLALIDTVFAAQQNPAFTNIALACPQTSDFYPGGKLGACCPLSCAASRI